MLWLLLVVAALVALFLYHTQVTLRYWERRRVPHHKPLPFIGNFGPIAMYRTNFLDMISDIIEPFRDFGYCGAYQLNLPILLVWDPDMAREVLSKQFYNFHDRGQPSDADNDPFSANLFNLTGPQWRRLRNKLSPTFTSGKLKLMLPLMRDVSRDLTDIMAADAKSNSDGEVDLHVLTTRFAADVLGTCAFGIQCNSLRNQNDEIIHLVRETARPNIACMFRFLLAGIHPKLARLIPWKFLFSESTKFFLTLMERTVEYREKHSIKRQDFVNLMLELRESDRDEPNPEKRIVFTNGLMTAQAFIFFVAGIDNIGNTAGYCLHQLAFDGELQRRAAEEVRAVTREYGGQLSYEALQKLVLVDRIVMEGLRLWPAISFIMRKCNRTTKVGDLLVESGQTVVVSNIATHMDPRYFPDPTRFDPDRFTKEATQCRHPYAYLPFGEGPRSCIAERYALLAMKLAIASVLAHFEITPSSRSGKTPVFDPFCVMPVPKHGFWVQVKPRGA